MQRIHLLIIGCAIVATSCTGKTPDVSFRTGSGAVSETVEQTSDFTNEGMPRTSDSLEVHTGTGSEQVRTLSGSVLIGEENAPRLIVYTDYACEYCHEFSADQKAVIEHEWVDNGRLALHLVFVPRSDAGSLMAKVALCSVEQGLFPLVDRQMGIRPVATEKDLPLLIKKTGLNAVRLKKCMAKPAIDLGLESMTETARDRGITRVPTFELGAESWQGLLPLDELRSILETELAKSLIRSLSEGTRRSPNEVFYHP